MQTHPELKVLFDYIQDNDLWQHKLPQSREFSAGLQAMRLELDVNVNPDLFQQLGALVVDDVCARGVAALQERDALIARLLPVAVPFTIPGGPAGTLTCLALEVDASTAEIRSALGNALAERAQQVVGTDVGAIIYHFTLGPGPHAPADAPDATWKVSLRSKQSDTTPFSQFYGGGGHRCASSFSVTRATLDTFRRSK